MAINQTQDDWVKTALRLPRELHQQVHQVAKEEDRTFNGQIVSLLRDGVQSRGKHDKLAAPQPQGAQQ